MSLAIVSDCELSERKLVNILLNYQKISILDLEQEVDEHYPKLCNIETKYFTAIIPIKKYSGTTCSEFFDGVESVIYCSSSICVPDYFLEICRMLQNSSDIQLKLFAHFTVFRY